MGTLHYVKASDIEYNYCFLEVFKNRAEVPFMDIRISDDKKLSLFIYDNQQNISLSIDEWSEIYNKAMSFYKAEIENEDAFESWNG
ncbi:MAG: hypothetical protein D3925_13560 [Candidatus Electrothrix sp. AR5]|nr:hypothetical protein [Candidatus Electrothrix sp. AR5]